MIIYKPFNIFVPVDSKLAKEEQAIIIAKVRQQIEVIISKLEKET